MRYLNNFIILILALLTINITCPGLGWAGTDLLALAKPVTRHQQKVLVGPEKDLPTLEISQEEKKTPSPSLLKKRAKWPWLLGALALIGGIAAAAGGGGGDGGSTGNVTVTW